MKGFSQLRWGSLLESFDLLGPQPTFTLNRKHFSQSLCGSFITCSFAAFMIFVLVVFAEDMILKQNPYVLFSEKVKDDVKYVGVGPGEDQFNMAINFQLLDGTPIIDYSIYYPFAMHWNVPGLGQQLEITPLPVKLCDSEDLGILDPDLVGVSFCFDSSQINATFTQGAISRIWFGFRHCDETAEMLYGVTCKDEETRRTIIDQGVFGSTHTDLSVSPKNYDKPFKQETSGDAYGTSFSQTRLVRYIGKEAIMITDDGWLIEDVSSQSAISIDYKEIMFENPKLGFLAVADIFMGKKFIEYERSYLKVQSLFAEVIGVRDVIYYCIVFFFTRHFEKSFYEKVCNQFYRIDLKNKGKKKAKSITDVFGFNRQNSDGPNSHKPTPRLKKLYQKHKRAILAMSKESANAEKVLKQKTTCDSGKVAFIDDRATASQHKYKFKSFDVGSSDDQSDKSLSLQMPDEVPPREKKALQYRQKKDEEIIEIGSDGDEPSETELGIKTIHKNLKNAMNQNIDQRSERLGDTYRTLQTRFNEPADGSQNGGGACKAKPASLNNLEAKASKKEKREQINYTFFDWLIQWIPKTKARSKRAILRKGQGQLARDIDIVNVLKKLHDVEKLKRILLTKDQRVLFEGLPRPRIGYQRNPEDVFYEVVMTIMDGEDMMMKKRMTDQAYKNLLKKRGQSEVDEKIIKMFEKQVIESQL